MSITIALPRLPEISAADASAGMYIFMFTMSFILFMFASVQKRPYSLPDVQIMMVGLIGMIGSVGIANMQYKWFIFV